MALSSDKRDQIFIDIINALWDFDIDDLKQIAEDASVSPSTLYNWRSGKTLAPRICTLIRVATVLGYSIKLYKSSAKLKLVNKATK